MKKKIMMAAVFIGALTLGACVDNKESDSVVAVRTAKAAQLNSIAAMNNADAEYKKAQAALEKALAEIKQAEADVAKATLETDIAEAKAKAEAALERAKADLEGAKAELIAALDATDIATKERIRTLLAKANAVLNGGSVWDPATGTITTFPGINTDRANLITAKTDLALYKAQVITAEILNKKSLIQEEKTKATAQALIAEYEKYSKDDLANAEKAANEAKAKAEALDKIDTDKFTALMNANQVYNEANTQLVGSRYYQNIFSLPHKVEQVEGSDVYYTNDDATTGSEWKDGHMKFTPDMDAINGQITDRTREISIAKIKLSEAEKALADVKVSDNYKDLQKAVADAQKKFDEATTSDDKNTAKGDLERAETNLKNATSSEEIDIEIAQSTLKDKEANLKSYNEKVAAVTGENAVAYNTLLDVFVKAIDNKVTAAIARSKSYHNWDVQNTLATTLENIAGNLTDFETEILAEKEKISRADETITGLNTASEEQTVLNQEAYIANLENNLSINEPIYQSYLDQIKALVGGTAE